MVRWIAPSVVLLAACGIGVRRDLSHVRIGRVGYEDLCGLQLYFDTLDARVARGPRVVLSVGAGRQGLSGGRDLWAFETAFALRHLRRLLRENWKDVPGQVLRARRLSIQVQWVNRAGIQRVVAGDDAELIAGRESFDLPYHPCLSELLYGAPLYRERRQTLGLPPPELPPPEAPDGGVAPRPDPWGLTPLPEP